MTHFRDRVTTMLEDARKSSSSKPEDSAPEGFGGVIRADAEVVAVLCRQFLSDADRGGPDCKPEPAQGGVGDTSPPGLTPEAEANVTIDELVIRDLLDQISNLNKISMRWLVYGRLVDTAIVEARVFPASAPGKGWLSLGQLQVILRRGMVW